VTSSDASPDSATRNLHILVLAAGGSLRLGQPKQLVRIHGRPLIHLVVDHAVSLAGQAVTVVLGAHAKEIAPCLKSTSASIVINREWEQGIASSIRAGIASLGSSSNAVMVLLGDQRAVTIDDLKRLASAWGGETKTIATAVYNGTFGVPAIFPEWCFTELMQLRGDLGAKVLLQRHRDRLVHVQMPNAAADLDTPEDLAGLVGEQ
jgi:molybdenum cofactor cytidylyltransferase